MLGVSSEMLIQWLIARFLDDLPEPKQAQVRREFAALKFRTDRLFESFIHRLREHFTEFSRDLQLQTDANLDLLQTLIRVTATM
jgi:hypothetical protein